MFKKLAAGLVAAALLAAPVVGNLVSASPADAATITRTKTVKATTVKVARTHRHHARNLRRVHVVGTNVRHARVHPGARMHRVSGYRAATVKRAHVSLRKHPRHVVKIVKGSKQVKQIKQEKTGRAG